MSYAEIKALATGNPYIKEKMTLENDLARLKVLRTNHAKQKYRLEDELNRGFPERIQKKQEQLAAGTEDLGAWNKNRMQNAGQFPDAGWRTMVYGKERCRRSFAADKE